MPTSATMINCLWEGPVPILQHVRTGQEKRRNGKWKPATLPKTIIERGRENMYYGEDGGPQKNDGEGG